MLSLCIFCTHSQEDTTICISREEFRNALKWASYGVECDTLIQGYIVKDSLKEEIIELQRDQIEKDQIIKSSLYTSNQRLKGGVYGLGGLSLVLLFVSVLK